MISIEAYRAAIGRFYGTARKMNKYGRARKMNKSHVSFDKKKGKKRKKRKTFMDSNVHVNNMKTRKTYGLICSLIRIISWLSLIICICFSYNLLFNDHTMLYKFLYDKYDTNYFQTCEFSEKDLKFRIATIGLGYDVSFLKLLKLIVDGDVEVNPGPTHNTGRKMKNKSFNFASKKLDMDNIANNNIRTVMNCNRNGPVGLINHANDCFF